MSTSPEQVDRTQIRLRRATPLLLLVTWLSVGTLLADRIELRTGEVFFGEILRANRREVSMRLESGGILSFRMNQVAFFRKNFVASDEWIPNPVLEIDDPTLEAITAPETDTSLQGSPSTAIEPVIPAGGVVVGPATDLDLTLVQAPFEDQLLRVSPPRGFLDWEAHHPLRNRFYDPVTQADLGVVDLGPDEDSLEAIKTKTARAHSQTATSGLRVLQDERIRDSAYQGWYFEFLEDMNGTDVRRIWVFARTARRTLLLKYSCPERHHEELRRPFSESIRSFSPLEVGPIEPEGPSPGPTPRTERPRNFDAAAELLRLLRKKNQPEGGSGGPIDE